LAVLNYDSIFGTSVKIKCIAYKDKVNFFEVWRPWKSRSFNKLFDRKLKLVDIGKEK
jgi:hypothetical protein